MVWQLRDALKGSHEKLKRLASPKNEMYFWLTHRKKRRLLVKQNGITLVINTLLPFIVFICCMQISYKKITYLIWP